MAVSTSKKVLIARFDRETLSGFVNLQEWEKPDGIEILTANGSATVIPYTEIRIVYFVLDFDRGEPRRESRIFNSRPKHEGVWVRLRLRGGEMLDGVMPNDLLQWESRGFSMIPPDPSLQNQRIYVPRAAVEEIRILGVNGNSNRRRRTRRPGAGKDQLEMFDGD